MKVKIAEGHPLASYTGKLSGVPFKDGASERELTTKEARRIGINIRIVNVDTGEQAGLLKPVSNVPAAPLSHADRVPNVEPEKPAVPEVKEEPAEEVHKYTKEELEQIAEEDGIRGVRAIGNKFNVKGVQISQLIAEILQAQGS